MFPSAELRFLLLYGLLTVWAARGQEVSGVVRDVAGSGLSNIAVEASVFGSTSFTQMVTTTDAAGRFGFPVESGSWTLRPSPTDLNALGFLDVASASFTLSNESRTIRFTTRKLDLDRRINGRLTDERGWSLSQAPLSASIEENQQRFATNLTTEFDGSFSFAATPATWRLQFYSGISTHVYPTFDAVVEPTNNDVTATIVAPRVTAQITGVASNLRGFEVIAECEAYGHRYVQAASLWGDNSSFFLPAFGGVWTVSVTNRYYRLQSRFTPPPPVTVAVSNTTVTLEFHGSEPTPRILSVKVLSLDGNPVTNASVSAYSGDGYLSPLPPVPGPSFGDPRVTRLQLSEGQWTISAWMSDQQNARSYQVSLDVLMSSSGESNLNLMLPIDGVGPRIHGTVRETDGAPLPGRSVLLQASEQGTNYTIWSAADANGGFEAHVVPGRWRLGVVESDPCWQPAEVTILDADQPVELSVCPSPRGAVAPLAITVKDETGFPAANFQISLTSSLGYYSTNAVSHVPVLAPVRPGIWTAYVSPDWSWYRNDPYELLPTLKFHHHLTGPSNLTLVARLGSVRIEGRLRDARGRLLTTGYVTARANIEGTNYSVIAGFTSGYFSLNVVPGAWEVAVSTWRYLQFGSSLAVPAGTFGPAPVQMHADPAPQLIRVTNGVTACEFVAGELPPRLSLTVSVVGEDGMGLAGAAVQVTSGSSADWREVDSGGRARFNVFPGTNNLSVFWGWRAVQWDQLLFPTVALNLDASSNHVVLVARTPTACLRGTVFDSDGNAVAMLATASTQVDGTNYATSACSDSRRKFCLPAIPGDWKVTVPDFDANDLGFQSLPSRNVTVPPSGTPPAVDFVLEPIVGDFRDARWSPLTLTSSSELRLELRAQTSLTWRVERSEDLRRWDAWSTVTTSNGVAHIPYLKTPSGRAAFFRAVWVQ